MDYDFTTKRLIVKEWHAFDPRELGQPDLVEIVKDMLTPDVTHNFPFMWKGNYTRRRAQAWIEERDSESKTLLAVEKKSNRAIGYVNFFTVGDRSQGLKLRLGYLVCKTMWRKGLATELVHGFIHWCRHNNISALFASVDPGNIASIRVLEKNDFSTETSDSNGIALLFEYDFLNQKIHNPIAV